VKSAEDKAQYKRSKKEQLQLTELMASIKGNQESNTTKCESVSCKTELQDVQGRLEVALSDIEKLKLDYENRLAVANATHRRVAEDWGRTTHYQVMIEWNRNSILSSSNSQAQIGIEELETAHEKWELESTNRKIQLQYVCDQLWAANDTHKRVSQDSDSLSSDLTQAQIRIGKLETANKEWEWESVRWTMTMREFECSRDDANEKLILDFNQSSALAMSQTELVKARNRTLVAGLSYAQKRIVDLATAHLEAIDQSVHGKDDQSPHGEDNQSSHGKDDQYLGKDENKDKESTLTCNDADANETNWESIVY
jgi:hypothetical protein